MTKRLGTLLAAMLLAGAAGAAEKPRVDTNDYDWVEGATLKIEGRGYDAPEEPYVRVPKRFDGKVPPAISGMGRESTGLNVRFRTSSRKLVIRWTVVPRSWTDPLIPPSGLQLVALWAKTDGDWEFITKAHPRKGLGQGRAGDRRRQGIHDLRG